MEDPLEVSQRVGIGEDDLGQLGGLVGPEAALDLGARLGIVVADLARDGVGVHGRRPEVAQHPGHGALSAADVAGQADHLHGPPDPTGSGWQWGQKWVLRWADDDAPDRPPASVAGLVGALVDHQPLRVARRAVHRRSRSR